MSVNIDNLRACVDLVDAELVATSAALTESRAAHAATAAELSETLALLAVAEARIAELEAQIGGPVDPPAVPLLVGATVVPATGESWLQATARFESLIGKPITVARRFLGSAPLLPFSSYDQFAADVGRRDRWVSFKGDPTDAQLEAFIRSIPVDGHTTGVAWNHEPENDGGVMTPAYFRARQARLLAVIRKVNRPDVYPMVVLMGWLENDGIASTTSAAWFPDEPAEWVLGVDFYDDKANRTYAQLATQTLDLWALAGGIRWAATEFGTARTGTSAATWITEYGQFARTRPGCIGGAWFDSTIGIGQPLAARGPEAVAAYAALIP